MKPWRAFLLVLLIVLLPLRGAIAATMLCPPGNHGAVAATPTEAHAHHHPDAGGHAPGESAAKAGPSHGSSCHVCASFCSATPLLAAMPVIQQPTEAQTLCYPAWAAPAPVFLSDGQERPPRST